MVHDTPVINSMLFDHPPNSIYIALSSQRSTFSISRALTEKRENKNDSKKGRRNGDL